MRPSLYPCPAPLQGPSRSSYAFGSGTADENFSRDSRPIDGTLRFAPGTTTRTVRVDLSTEQGAESLESFYMQLSLPTNASIANDVVWATIVDNDTVVTDGNASGTIEAAEKAELLVRDVVVDEKAGTATFVVLWRPRGGLQRGLRRTATVAGGNATRGGLHRRPRGGSSPLPPGRPVKT